METDTPSAPLVGHTLQNVVRIPSGSTVKHLAKTIGGEWAYDPALCGWYCSDGRHLNRCCQRDYGDEFVTEYWMYYPDGQSERGEKFLYANPKVRGGAQSSDVAKQEEQDHA